MHRRLLVLLSILATTACIPLPIPHTAQVAPAVTGTLLRDDGGPLAGIRVATAETPKPGSCAWSSASGVTDSLGRFSMPGLRVRKRVFYLSMVETFGTQWYSLCARSPDAALSSAGALVTDIVGWMGHDSVTCLVWRPPGAARLTCNNRRGSSIETGGSWSDASGGGVFRLVTAPIDTGVYGELRTFVQWVTLLPNGQPGAARATVELAAPAIDRLPAPRLVQSGNRWLIVVKSNRPKVKGDDRFLTFELGAPGEVRARPNISPP